MKRASAHGRGDAAGRFHPLFAPVDGVSAPDYAPEPIWRIFVTRFETRGPVQALRPYTAEELDGNDKIFQLFGGGTYELVARRDNGTIYAKRVITIPGDAKSLTGEEPKAPAVAGVLPTSGVPGQPAGAVAPSDPNTMLLSFVMQQNISMMTMLGGVMTAALTGKQGGSDDTAKIIGETMRTTIEMMKAAMPAPVAPAAPVSPISAAREVLEVARMINPPPPVPKPPPPKEEGVSDVIKALADGVGPLIQMAISAAGQKVPAMQAAPMG